MHLTPLFPFEGNIEFSSVQQSMVEVWHFMVQCSCIYHYFHVWLSSKSCWQRERAIIYVRKGVDRMIQLEYLWCVLFNTTMQQVSSIFPTLSFNNDTADVVGTTMYGGSIDNCTITFQNAVIKPFSLGLFVVNNSECDLSPVSVYKAGIPNYCTDVDGKNEVATIFLWKNSGLR